MGGGGVGGGVLGEACEPPECFRVWQALFWSVCHKVPPLGGNIKYNKITGNGKLTSVQGGLGKLSQTA